MTIEKLFNKYGHVEVFAVANNEILKEHEKNWNNMSPDAVEKKLESIGEFVPRYRAEIDKNFRQIIPYCIIRFEDSIFTTQRLGGDERLVGRLSIGIGGHIEKVDTKGDSVIRDALFRELDEEVDIKSNILELDMLGYICMDTTLVDCVHYGLAYSIALDGKEVFVKETDTLSGRWYTKKELLGLKESLEEWSIYCLENFL